METPKINLEEAYCGLLGVRATNQTSIWMYIQISHTSLCSSSVTFCSPCTRDARRLDGSAVRVLDVEKPTRGVKIRTRRD
jgi:hypothetical protein